MGSHGIIKECNRLRKRYIKKEGVTKSDKHDELLQGSIWTGIFHGRRGTTCLFLSDGISFSK